MEKTLSQYGLHHVGYVVKDMDKVLQEMKENLGDITYQMYDFRPSKAWCYGKPVEDYQLKIAMISLEEHHTNIEIIHPISEGMHMDAATRMSGIHHLCFAVTGDYDDWKKHFQDTGAQFIFESETEDTLVGYRRCFYIQDNCGNIVEIKETPYFRSREEV